MFPDVIDRVRVRFDRDILITIRSVLIIPVKRMQDQGRLLAPIALFLNEPTPAFRLILIVQRREHIEQESAAGKQGSVDLF